jgi:ABC-type phosphate transport system ATPase subunit
MAAIREELVTTEEVSAPLLAKEVAIEEIGSLRDGADKFSRELDRIDSLATEVRDNADEIKTVADTIQSCIARVNKEIATFVRNVETASVEIEQMMLSADAQIDEQSIRDAMAGMHGSSVNSYVRGRGDLFDVARAQADPLDFLEELFSGQIRLTGSTTKEELANRVLSVVPEVRFKATLEGDSIGGFEPSSMTPGKQALFALSLTLGSDQDGWPLLLDQPEDDLDSRSIFGTIAHYLMDQKKKRQIIMVTHNANLAIGADSEQILVANRHGTDHPNEDGRRFSYLGGSLEHERNPNPGASFALDRLDVPSHACEILDGGEEAFKKRSQRYLI